jgi:acyl-CoA synthetase (AMP-forming)/AMP-acid ligase II
VVVVGVPHEKWGEAPLAVVFAEDDAALDEHTIIEACSINLGSYKKPAQVVFRDEPLLRSVVGKIQRKVIREPFWADRTLRVSGS